MFDMLLLLCRRDGCVDSDGRASENPRVEGNSGYQPRGHILRKQVKGELMHANVITERT